MYAAEAGALTTANRTSHLHTAEPPTQPAAQSDHCASSVSDGRGRHGEDFRVQDEHTHAYAFLLSVCVRSCVSAPAWGEMNIADRGQHFFLNW